MDCEAGEYRDISLSLAEVEARTQWGKAAEQNIDQANIAQSIPAAGKNDLAKMAKSAPAAGKQTIKRRARA